MSVLRRTNRVFFSIKNFFSQSMPTASILQYHNLAASCTQCRLNGQAHVFTQSASQGTTYVKRQQHSSSVSALNDMSTFQKFKWNMGFYGKLQVPNRHLILAGYNLYICCTDFIDFSEFVREVKLPDTFTSWFLLLQLHMWLVNVKVSQMGKEGILLKQHVYRAMWTNVETRLERFEDMLGSERRKAMKDFYSLMLLSILYYDEGLLGSDKQLANSLWIQLYGQDPDVDAVCLEKMVEYVRKQVHHHDQLDPYPIMKPGYISFLPLVGDKLDQKKAQADRQTLSRS